MITSQLKGLFGMTYPGRGFLKIWYGFFLNVTTIKLTDMGASLTTFLILFLIKVMATDFYFSSTVLIIIDKWKRMGIELGALGLTMKYIY